MIQGCIRLRLYVFFHQRFDFFLVAPVISYKCIIFILVTGEKVNTFYAYENKNISISKRISKNCQVGELFSLV